ncbi:DUF2164 domain-containing protein [Parasalinivibrio latis]|uniref:DUF2164 domain-containing protein n=1 Tax=Parasalinivibrio latis TaxID=2952610 RepID=UPI0030E2DD51
MSKIDFTRAEKDVLVRKIQFYFDQELEQEIGQFDAEFLLDFFSEELGAYYYNRGLYDAQLIIQEKVESISDAIYEIEKPTNFSK